MASGDDPELHRAGKDFYSQVEKMRPQLSASVSARGQDLVQSGHPLPVSDRSVHRNLFVRDGTGRRSFEAEALPEDTSSLRPGVMLRSPLQDWLFHPVAVVVGPGEQAYLKQLEPVYELVGIERSLLLPRLFATVIPHSFPVEQLRSEDASEPPIDPEQLARRAAEVSEKEVRSILEKDLGINSERAAQLAAGRARRWEKTLRTMFSNELADKVRQQPRKQPEWVFPASGRQERSLSCLTTLAQHGCPLVQAVLDCAEDHLAKGQNNNWQDYLVLVHDPQWNQKSSE